jgi:hypothetical protein
MPWGDWQSGETLGAHKSRLPPHLWRRNEREDCRLGPHGARDRIDDQRASKPPAAKSLVDGEPADKACRKGRITGQSLGLLGRQFREGKTGRGEGVVARDLSGGIERDKAIADPAADILCRSRAGTPQEKPARS